MTDASADRPVDGPAGDGSLTASVEDLFSDLADLAAGVRDGDAGREVRDLKRLLAEAHERGLIDSDVRDLGVRDAAEALVGSVIFASPLLIEDGVFDIAEHLFGVTVAGAPVFLIANTLFVVLMTYALLEWTGRNTDETQVLLGVVPVRLLMTLGISFLVAALLMTVWGRVDGWASPVEALARVNVIWTVGSLGAALGDIISKGDPAPAVAPPGDTAEAADRPTTVDIGGFTVERPPESVRRLTDGDLLDAIHAEFDDLESAVEDPASRRDVNRVRSEAVEAAIDDGFGDEIRKYTSRDVAEGFVGSVFFAIPFLVEDGVFDVAAYFLSFRVSLFPVVFLLNAAFVLLMILALVYWAGPQDVRVTRPILGFVPRRLVGIALVSFLTAAALMTVWGRVDGWRDPVVALARISVVWTVASFGASLGDILPGESSGEDINDDISALGERT